MNLTSSYLKKLIIEKAKELGFVQVGFSKAETLEKESSYLREWLDNGHAADMNWIEKGFEKRRNIRLIMEDAKSVISLAYNYYTPFEHDENLPKISRYAWGKDYHKILKKKLKELCETISHCEEQSDEAIPAIESKSPFIPLLKGGLITETTPNPLLGKEGTTKHLSLNKGEYPCPPEVGEGEGVLETDKEIAALPLAMKAYVDDGPVMDKVWAVKSGIGAMGKHTNVINTRYGSWIFLCNIITNIEFDSYDSPVEDLCGSCTLCISACPTGAIMDEYKVDANLCISYQTIENRGDIPDSINLDGWIFGCDVCQDVCPYNSPKFNHPTDDLNFYPKNEMLETTPNPLLSKEGTTESLIEKSPLKKGDKGGCPENDGDFRSPIKALEDKLRGNEKDATPPFTKGGQGGFKNKQELNSITEEEFTEIFSDSPIKRTKFKGWKRNLNKIQ